MQAHLPPPDSAAPPPQGGCSAWWFCRGLQPPALQTPPPLSSATATEGTTWGSEKSARLWMGTPPAPWGTPASHQGQDRIWGGEREPEAPSSAPQKKGQDEKGPRPEQEGPVVKRGREGRAWQEMLWRAARLETLPPSTIQGQAAWDSSSPTPHFLHWDPPSPRPPPRAPLLIPLPLERGSLGSGRGG